MTKNKILAAGAAAGLIVLMWAFGSKKGEESDAPKDWKERGVILGKLDAELTRLADGIQSAQGESRCESDGQCRIIGLGAKVCELYKDFLVYSIKGVNEPVLLGLVDDFNAAHLKRLNLGYSANQCGVQPPGVRCVGQRCVSTPQSGS